MDDDVIIASYDEDPDGLSRNEEIRSLSPNGRQFRQLTLPAATDCEFTTYLFPTRLPDGRLGLIQSCLGGKAGTTDVRHMVAYSLDTRDVVPLVDEPIDWESGLSFAWSPDLDRGLIGLTNGLCATLWEMGPTGYTDSGISVPAGGGSYDIDPSVVRSGDCVRKARADTPAWSPDGTQVAFTFSPPRESALGPDRLDDPWDIYVMGTDFTPARVLRGMTDPSTLSWAPDGGRVAFSGSIRGRGAGTWVLSPETGGLSLVSRRVLRFPDWSPDGSHIVGIFDVDPGSDENRTELWRIRVPR